MNWYKKSQVMVDTPTGIDIPVDNDDDDGEDWENCYQVVQKWVVDNIQSEPLASIQNAMIENIAIHHFQNGIYPDVMIWHEDEDFFKSRSYRAVSVNLSFAGYWGEETEEFEGGFDFATKTEEWLNLLRQSNLLQMIQGGGCGVRFIDEELYLFVLGELCNGLCYRNKQLSETFQTYLDNNLEKMSQDILGYLSMSELSRYISSDEIMSQFAIGDEALVMNGGMKCYPNDYRYETIGINFKAETTVYIDIPDEIEERFNMQAMV
jgi:hypothetical protein